MLTSPSRTIGFFKMLRTLTIAGGFKSVTMFFFYTSESPLSSCEIKIRLCGKETRKRERRGGGIMV